MCELTHGMAGERHAVCESAFIVDEVALRRVYLRILQVSLISFIPLFFLIHVTITDRRLLRNLEQSKASLCNTLPKKPPFVVRLQKC